MSQRSTGQDLMLNLTPARAANVHQVVGSPNTSEKSSESSCLSSNLDEYEEEDDSTIVQYRPEVTSMVLVGCPRCLMYVMLSEVDPKCPQCKSTVFLDFLNQENAKWAK